MRVEVSFKYLENSDFVNNILDNNLKKIGRRIKIFRKNDPIHVSVHLEKNPHKEQYFCRSHVYLPASKVLIADEKGKNVSLAINKSFSALTKQLAKVKYRRESYRRRRKLHIKESSED